MLWWVVVCLMCVSVRGVYGACAICMLAVFYTPVVPARAQVSGDV